MDSTRQTCFLDGRFPDFVKQGAIGIVPQPRLRLEQERINQQGAAVVIGGWQG